MAGIKKLYPRIGDKQTVYLKNVITDPATTVGDYMMYNDFANDPVRFEKNNALYHCPINRDRLVIGKFCSIACGAKFLSNSASHTLSFLSTCPSPLFFEEWGLEKRNVAESRDNKGDIVLGSDAWIGYEAITMAGVTVGDGATIGARVMVTKDASPYTVAGGIPVKPIKKRYPEETIVVLSELKWWDWPESRIAQNLHVIQAGQLNELK